MVVLYALLGLLAGAFLNLMADHLPRRQSILNLSQCPACGERRGLLENVSVLSFLSLRGRCPHCGAAHPWRRPALELLTMSSFALFWQRYGPSTQLILVSVYSCVLFLVFVIDLEQRLILRVVILPSMLIAIAGSFFYPGLGVLRAVLGGAFAYVVFLLLVIIGKVVLGRGAMGGGDVNLAAFIGLITGFPDVVLALTIGMFLGGLVSLILVLSRVKRMKSYIPYGVFLVVGGLAVLIFGQEIIAWYFALY